MNKILFLSHLSPSTNNSATENYVIECMEALYRSGNEIIVSNYSLFCRLNELEKHSFSFCGLFKGKYHIISIINAIIFLLLRKIKGQKITIISHNISRKYIFVYRLAKILGMEVTFWVLDYYPDRDSFYKECFKKYAKKAVCINKNINKVVSVYCPSEIFYGGYSGEVQKSKNLKNSGNRPKNIVYAGTLSKLNGVDLLIDLVSNTKLELTLDIFGDGECRESVKTASEKITQITYHGLVKREVVLQKMREADFLPLPRRTNNDYYKWFFPSKIIEMIAMPGITICSEMKGVTDVISEVVVLEKISNWKDLEMAIVDSMNTSPEKLLIKERQREILFSTQFNWDLLPSKLIGTDDDE